MWRRKELFEELKMGLDIPFVDKDKDIHGPDMTVRKESYQYV